jgi:hypothetical protein
VIARDRRLAKGLLVLPDKLGIALAHRFRREVGIGDQEAGDGRAGGLYEIGGVSFAWRRICAPAAVKAGK